MITFQKQAGQSLVETLVLSLTLIAVIHFTVLMVWIGTHILWIEHQLYQGLVCAAEQKNLHLCKQTVLKQIKTLSSSSVITSLKIKNFQNKWKGEILWNFYNKNFLIKQSLILP